MLGRLKALAAWRELEARAKNLPRGRIMKDETLADVAIHPPREPGGARQGARPLGGLEGQRYRRADDGGARQRRAAARRPSCRRARIAAPGLGREGALVADLLKLLLKIRARESNVAPRLVAKSEELELLAAGRREGLAILEGWRFEEFGRDALDLVEGRLAFAIRDGKLVDDPHRAGGRRMRDRACSTLAADGLRDGRRREAPAPCAAKTPATPRGSRDLVGPAAQRCAGRRGAAAERRAAACAGSGPATR